MDRTVIAFAVAVLAACSSSPAPVPAAGSAASAVGSGFAGSLGDAEPTNSAATDSASQADAQAQATPDAAQVDVQTELDSPAVADSALDDTPADDAAADFAAAADADGGAGLDSGAALDSGADAGTDAVTADSATAADSDSNVASQSVTVVLSAGLVETASVGGVISVQCKALALDGSAAPDPGDFKVSFTGGVPTAVTGGHSFAKPGLVTAVCTSDLLGFASATFTVAHIGLDPGLSRLATGLGKAAGLADGVIQGASNPATQATALKNFHTLGLTMTAGLGQGTKVLLPLPKGLPTAAKLTAKGLVPSADDGPFKAKIAELKLALLTLQTTLAAINPKTAGEVDKLNIDSQLAMVATAAQALKALKPSALGTLAALPELDELLGVQLPKTVQVHHLFISKVFHAQPGAPALPPCPNCFSLVGFAVSLGVQYALASVPSYTSILKDLGWVIGEMVVTLTIKEVLDTQFPAVAGGPSITAVEAMGQAAIPGSPLKVLASNFGDKPGDCAVIFVTPLVAKNIVDAIKLAVGGIPSLKDLKSKSAWEAAKVVKEAVDKVKEVVEFTGGLPDLAASGVVTMPSQAGSQFDPDLAFIDLGVVPKKINCGIVPKPGILYPVCAFSGSGSSFQILVIQEKCP